MTPWNRIIEQEWCRDDPKKFRLDIQFPSDPSIMDRLKQARDKLEERGRHIYQRRGR